MVGLGQGLNMQTANRCRNVTSVTTMAKLGKRSQGNLKLDFGLNSILFKKISYQ